MFPYLLKEKEIKKISWLSFIGVCYFDSIDDLSLLHLKDNSVNQIKTAITLAKEVKNNKYTRLHLFEYGVRIVQLANNINKYIFNSKDNNDFIDKEYLKMPIHSLSDLAIDGNDVLNTIEVKDKRQISVILEDIKRNVLLDKLDNRKECILKYIKKHY